MPGQHEESVWSDLRGLPRYVQIEPLASVYLERCVQEHGKSANFLAKLRSYYLGIVEFVTMNGNRTRITNLAIQRKTGVNERAQKEYRNFLIDIRLLAVSEFYIPKGGGRKGFHYGLLRVPYMGYGEAPDKAKDPLEQPEIAPSETPLNEGAGSGIRNREEFPTDADLVSYPQGAGSGIRNHKDIKDTAYKETTSLAAAPRDLPTNSEDSIATATGILDDLLDDQEGPYADDPTASEENETSAPLSVAQMRDRLLGDRSKLSHKQMVGYLVRILLDGAGNRKRVSRPDGRPLSSVYKQVGALLTRFPIEFIVDVFSRWQAVPMRNGEVSLIAPATSVYPLWASAREVARAEALKAEGPVLPEELLRRVGNHA